MVSESPLSLGDSAHYVPEKLYFSCRTPTLFLVPLGAIPSIIYVFYSGPAKSVFLTNVLALSFGHQAMSLLKIDSFKTGGILLLRSFPLRYMVGVWDESGTTIPLVLGRSVVETDGGNVDGQRRHQPRPPHEDTLAQVN